MDSNLIYLSIFFLVIFIFGFWVSRTGKPYSVLLLAVHKLAGVAAGATLAAALTRIHKVNPIHGAAMTTLVFSILFFVGLVATGGLLSTEKEMPAPVLWIHKILPYLAVGSTAVTVYLLR